MPTPCEQLGAMIDAETDETKRNAMLQEYWAHCRIGGDQKPDLGSGGGGHTDPDK